MNKVIVLEGNIVERKRVLNKIKGSFADNIDITIFDEKNSFDYVSHALTEVSCFSEDRLFIMTALPTIEAPSESQARAKVLNHLKKLFPDISAGNILIMNNIGISGESFLKEVRKYGEVHQFKQKIKKFEGNKLVNSYFKSKNIIFDQEVTQALTDSLNLNGDDIDVDKLYLLLTKFYHYVYDKNKVTKKDVYDVCSSSQEFIIWSLYKILDGISVSEEKDVGSAINMVYEYLDNSKYFEHEAVMIVRGMVWRYGLLLLAKNGANNKLSQHDIVENILKITKLESKGKSYNIKMNPKILKDEMIPEYSKNMINSVMNDYYGKPSLSCYTYDQLLLIYYTLGKIILKVRSGCVKSEIKIAIFVIISVVCGVISKKNTIDGILEHNKLMYGMDK